MNYSILLVKFLHGSAGTLNPHFFALGEEIGDWRQRLESHPSHYIEGTSRVNPFLIVQIKHCIENQYITTVTSAAGKFYSSSFVD